MDRTPPPDVTLAEVIGKEVTYARSALDSADRLVRLSMQGDVTMINWSSVGMYAAMAAGAQAAHRALLKIQNPDP